MKMNKFMVGDVVRGAWCSGRVVLVGDIRVLVETVADCGHDGHLDWVLGSGFVPDPSKKYWSILKEGALLVTPAKAFKGNTK